MGLFNIGNNSGFIEVNNVDWIHFNKFDITSESFNSMTNLLERNRIARLCHFVLFIFCLLLFSAFLLIGRHTTARSFSLSPSPSRSHALLQSLPKIQELHTHWKEYIWRARASQPSSSTTKPDRVARPVSRDESLTFLSVDAIASSALNARLDPRGPYQTTPYHACISFHVKAKISAT